MVSRRCDPYARLELEWLLQPKWLELKWLRPSPGICGDPICRGTWRTGTVVQLNCLNRENLGFLENLPKRKIH